VAAAEWTRVSSGKLPPDRWARKRQSPMLILRLEHPAPYLPELLTHPSALPLPRAVVAAKGAAWARPGNYVSNGPILLERTGCRMITSPW
jgi:oligopeptide transport system substrate-binding protein